MNLRWSLRWLVPLVGLLVAACSQEAPAPAPAPEPEAPAIPAPAGTAGMVDDARINASEMAEPGSWLSYGKDYREQRYSTLTEINRENVAELGLEWYLDLDTIHPLEATPLVVDGVMYLTSAWNITYALNAVTGEEIWRYDPEVPGEFARKACCGVISRGLAVYEGRVHVATLDGRLLALDAADGSLLWEVDTVIDRERFYTITGAPRAAAGKVYIGNGGAEFGVRGYVTAYDAATGEEEWRFFTVPGNPALPFEHPEMEMAAETWKGGEWWEIGGGGTAWNSIVYDPDFHSVYIGVGNGAPWTRAIRSPGGGDNLFLSSIVALDADTGEMKWYYQTTPGDNWDYTAVQDIMLAEMNVDGVDRKVLMQAPKNGFFYVIDRADGTLLRAHPYGAVTWATHVDMETGRPVENPEVDYSEEEQWILPGPLGAHNWQAMAFDPERGLVYFPAQDAAFVYALDDDYKETGLYKRSPGRANMGIEFGRIAQLLTETPGGAAPIGYLKAFDPLTGETAWQVQHADWWNGGTVATAAGLVFQGDSLGNLSAFDSDDGSVLWQSNTFTSIVAPPMTYAVDGKQYVAIMTGAGIRLDAIPETATYQYGNWGKVVVYALGGTGELPTPTARDLSIPEQPALTASAADIARGEELYHDICGTCHGLGAVSSGTLPDLRMMTQERHAAFNAVVLDGILRNNGMAGFSDTLDASDASRIQQYLIKRATEDRAAAGEA